MSLFGRLMNKSSQPKNYVLLSNWLDRIMEQELPKGIVAYNFNLYEGSNGTYDIQLVGTDEYDEDDGDWACTDYFTSGENICYIKRTNNIKNWKKGHVYIKRLLEQYLTEGIHAQVLKKATVIGIGFVDGDIDIIYRA